MRCATGLMGMAGRAAALALLVQPLAGVEAQGTTGAGEAEKAQKSRAMTCASYYAASASVADSASMVVMLERQMDLQRRFGLDHRTIYDLANVTMMDRNPDLLEFEATNIAACDREFGFSPVTALSGGKLVIAQGANPVASPQTTPRFSDLACSSIFWVAGLAWPQEREGWLGYANRAVAQHLAANPKDTMTQAEAKVMADGQARARLLQQGGAEPEKFKRDLTICANQFGIPSNTPTPAAAPAAKPAAPAPVPTRNLASREDVIYRCFLVTSRAQAGIQKAGQAPSRTLKLFAATRSDAYTQTIRDRHNAQMANLNLPPHDRRPVAPPVDTKAIDAEVDALAVKGNDALHAELRRCWTIFNDRPVPADLI